MSKKVFQFPGSLQRAAMQNFAEFQCRSETDWQHFTPKMKDALQEGLSREDRWQPRAWVACCVCAMQGWLEDRVSGYLVNGEDDAGRRTICCFRNPTAVAKLLDPEAYIKVWTSVPAFEVRQSAVRLELPPWTRDGLLINMLTGERPGKMLLLHQRRVTKEMKEGKKPANFCRDCYECLTKAKPEMPVQALACGKWLGRHPEIERIMPYGHLLLFPCLLYTTPIPRD